jgi:hypothetical protein
MPAELLGQGVPKGMADVYDTVALVSSVPAVMIETPSPGCSSVGTNLRGGVSTGVLARHAPRTAGRSMIPFRESAVLKPLGGDLLFLIGSQVRGFDVVRASNLLTQP